MTPYLRYSFLFLLVSVGVSQTCIGIDDGELSVESSTGFFMNDASQATCSGTLTQWRYCYYTGQTQPGATARLGLYRNVGTDSYELASGSVTLVTVSSVPSSPSFVCGAVAPPQNVAVMPGDIIGACLPSASNAIALLSVWPGRILKVPKSEHFSSPTCDTLLQSASSDGNWTEHSYVLHMYADIDGCGVNNGGCSHMCTPIDVVGNVSCTDDVDECASNNGGCVQYCINTPGSFVCITCDPGYQLAMDGTSCEDTDECASNNGGCAQVCANTEGSYNCACDPGYQLVMDGTLCEVSPPYLLYVDSGLTGSSIIATDLNGENARTLVSNSGPCTLHVDYDLRRGKLYWSDQCGYIYMANLDGSSVSVLYNPPDGSNTKQFWGLAVDWKRSKVYFSQYGQGDVPRQIIVYNVSNNSFHVFLDREYASGLAIDPNEGWLYWTSAIYAEIWRIGLNGDLRTLIHDTELYSPYFISIGFSELEDDQPRIYWTDNLLYKVETSFADGSSRAELLSDITDAFDVCFFNDTVFFTDSDYRQLRALLPDGSVTLLATVASQHDTTGVNVVSIFRQPITTDFNECASNNGGCEQYCINTPGSFVCVTCDPGYQLAMDGTSCEDINECLSSNGGCAHNCSNTDGSFVCSCAYGYELGTDGMTCNDINECLSSNGGCTHNCSNTDGSFVCSCDSGYELGTDGMACNDINECLSSNGGCAHNCSNTDGSFVCSCVSGYELGTDGMACNDVNECLTQSSNGGCSHSCFNTDGSFLCSCASGFQLDTDGMACKTIANYPALVVGLSSSATLLAIFLVATVAAAVIAAIVFKNKKKGSFSLERKSMQREESGFHVYDKVSGGESSIPMTTVVSENHDKVHEQLPPDNEQAEEETILRNPTYDRTKYSVSFLEPFSEEDKLYQQMTDVGIREIEKDALKISESLGSGQFGLVNRGVWSSPHGNIDVALKTLNDDVSQEDRVKFLQEAAIMGQFKHPNVVKLYGIIHGPPVTLLVELMSKGDLENHLISLKSDSLEPETPELLLSFSQQVAQGMQCLSSKSFVHRDLAARNILVSGKNICKVADFGMSRDLADENYYVSHGGMVPVRWTAPEAILYKKFSTASDVWSYGCLLYEIWSLGHKPLELVQNFEVIEYLSSGQRLPPPPGCPEIVYKLMIQCWHPEASERPAFSDIISALMDYDARILFIPKEALETNPQAGVLGAPLKAGKGMYTQLQNSYIHSE